MNIADAILIRMLVIMAEDPEGEFYQREIAKMACISIGATSQKIKKLSEKGLVTSKKAGRMMFYKYNLDDPIARQFKILLNVNAVHEMMQELKEHVKRIIMFGSCAEGTNVKGSDVDLFILTEDDKRVRQIVRGHADKIGKKFSPIVVNANGFRQLRSKDKPLYERINKGIILWEAQ